MSSTFGKKIVKVGMMCHYHYYLHECSEKGSIQLYKVLRALEVQDPVWVLEFGLFCLQGL